MTEFKFLHIEPCHSPLCEPFRSHIYCTVPSCVYTSVSELLLCPAAEQINSHLNSRYRRSPSRWPHEPDLSCSGAAHIGITRATMRSLFAGICASESVSASFCADVYCTHLQELSVCSGIWLQPLSKGLLFDYILASCCVSLLHSSHVYTDQYSDQNVGLCSIGEWH